MWPPFHRVVPGAAGALLAGVLALALPASAGAADACRIFAATTASGSLELTNAQEWHLRQDDAVGIWAVATKAQDHVQISTYLFGIAVPVWKGSYAATDTFTSGIFQVIDFSRFARVAPISVATNNCRADLTIYVDDADAVFTVAGGVGAVLGALGILFLLLLSFRHATAVKRILGGFAGLIFGVGVGLLAQQTGVLDPRNMAALSASAAGLLLGLMVPGCLLRKPALAPALTEAEAARVKM